MEQLNKEFSTEQQTLMEEFDTERTMMQEQHEREMNELQDILFAMEQNFNDRENEAKADFQSMRDEIKNKVYTVVWQTGELFHQYIYNG